MAAAFSIVGDLLLRTGSFETDTKRASKALKDFNKEALESAKASATALLGLAAAAAAAFFVIERGAASIGKFKDLGDVIGDTGEAVASLQTAADVSGSSINDITTASVKLTAALSKTDDEAEGAGAALKALNLPLADFKRLSPVAQLESVAKALDGFKDGAEKTAIAVALFGKAGAQLLPFLKELNDQGGRRTIISQDQIDAADKFSDTVTALRSTLTQFGQSVLADLLPPFQAFVDELGKAEAAMTAFQVAGAAVRIFFETIVVVGANVVFVFKGIGTEIGGIAAQLVALGKLDFKGFNAISTAMKEDAAKARAELDKFEQRILGATDNAAATRALKRQEDRGFDPRKKLDTSAFVKKTATQDDPTKKLLENQLKALDIVIKGEQDLFTRRNRGIADANELGLVSIQAFYDAQIAIVEASTSAQVSAIDKQIALVTAARDKALKGGKQTDAASEEGKLQDLIEKRVRIQEDADDKIIESAKKKTEAEKRYADQIKGISANVLELQGNLSAAAAIRFDLANADLYKRALAEGDQNALKLLNTLRSATIAQADFTRATDDFQKIITDLAIKEDRIQISRKLGAATELGALQQLGEARQKATEALEKQIRILDEVSNKTPQQTQQLEQLRVKLEELAATADPLGDKFRGIFVDSLGDSLASFVTGARTAKEAFNDFATSVSTQIAKMAAQGVAEQIFGSGSGGGSLLGQLFSGIFGGARASGGAVEPGKAFLVGESGREMFVPNTAGRIVPSSETERAMGGGGRPVQVIVQVQPGQVDSRTGSQIATQAGVAVQRALARGNA